MKKRIGVGILGGTGYGAGELLRLLVAHPEVEVVSIVSSSNVGNPVAASHPHLRGFYGQCFAEQLDLQRLAGFERAVIFSALPNGISSHEIAAVLKSATVPLIVIDLSGDFRLHDAQLRRQFYPESAYEELADRTFVYGLSELNALQLRGSRFVANPGCLATACILACAPLARCRPDDSGYRGEIAFSAMTGSTGSGRVLKETTHHPTRFSNVKAYKPLAHQHEPEIAQAFGDPRSERILHSFVAHSLPLSRGIYVTAHLWLPASSTSGELQMIYEKFYSHSPFVRVLREPPELNAVLGTNFCDVAIVARGKQLVAMAALDNLVKGMAGQAVQNMNLICELPEIMGLWTPALGPA